MGAKPGAAILWLREDLRLADNPALAAAAAYENILCVYTLDEETPGLRAPGGAFKWRLHHALEHLARDLAARGARLDIFRGSAESVIPALVDASGASALYWNRRYDSASMAIDARIKTALKDRIHVESFNGKLIAEPWTIKTKTGGPFRVFTPFLRALRQSARIAPAASAPRTLRCGPTLSQTLDLRDLDLTPSRPDWAAGLRATQICGEKNCAAQLAEFLGQDLLHYAEQRDFPARDATSRLSAALATGEISPQLVWRATMQAAEANPALQRGAEKFISELVWREFSYHLLFHNPDLARKNFNARFDEFPWAARDEAALAAWRAGMTGYPLVDAGMRELWKTGFMHNRVRMVCASFLIKHLLIDWRVGEDWFWDTLCDADPANNAASWQWVAGSGADAAPYFRIFNPVTQSEKFDAGGAYLRAHVPEIAHLPDKFIHAPWTAPQPPKDYPAPIVDHAHARERALRAFREMGT
ncbi:MAG: deoxyribodipyrimidine photo-lyase [Hyphomicrobiales bacterium]|nr:deoxyribodipyrimidine photo-lyase [Hyphomicrobiales bacterium]